MATNKGFPPQKFHKSPSSLSMSSAGSGSQQQTSGGGGGSGGNGTSAAQQLPFGDASGIALLLANHDAFGFSERACYHFDLIETLTQTPESKKDNQRTEDNTKNSGSTGRGDKTLTPIDETQDKKDKEQRVGAILENKIDASVQLEQFPLAPFSTCGVVSLLECTSQASISEAPKAKRKRLKRLLNKKIKDFNLNAQEARNTHISEKKDYCHQPKEFPLHLTTTTRVAFAYELTRMVFCIDASPSLTATFGNLGTEQQADDGAICAIDRLEKMARVFFRGLVQPIKGISAKLGKKKANSQQRNTSWSPQIAVTVVACYPSSIILDDQEETFSILVSDYRIHDLNSANTLCDNLAHWVAMEVESSIAAKFSHTGGRLDSSKSSLRQIIETCEACDAATLPREAKPCFVVATDCRAVDCACVMDLVRDERLKDTPLHVLDLSGSKTHGATNNVDKGEFYNISFDHDGPSSFPLSIADDSEALYNACKSTRGHLFDLEILNEACDTMPGEVSADSPFHDDFYFRRLTMILNALQWYIIFSLSPCCQVPRSFSWAIGPTPKYIKQRREIHQKQSDKMIFKYTLSPVRVKGLLAMRIMDGFRTRKYGSTSQDPDKVSIKFTLNIDLGTAIIYELSFVASKFHNAMVGTASVKISLLGESSFVDTVKNRYILSQFNQTAKKTRMSVKEMMAHKICNFLEWIRDEDVLESNICPLDWEDKLSDGSIFLASLYDLTSNHIYRHFRLEAFEVLYMIDPKEEDDIKSVERKLASLISEWSTRIIKDGLYLRQLPTTEGDLTHYCLVEIASSIKKLRTYTISMHFFEQVDSQERLKYLESLKMTIKTSFIILPRPCSKFISPTATSPVTRSAYNSMNLYQSESWALLSDSELFPLITKRRCQFDQFCPVYVTTDYTILLKFVRDVSNKLYLVQYSLKRLADKVIVNLLMDYQREDFSKAFQRFHTSYSPKMFSEIYESLIERDQKCARALRSRRNLLNLFDVGIKAPELVSSDQTDDVDRLLLYAEKFIIKLRFFNEKSGTANKFLETLTSKFILSGSLDVEVTELSVGKSEYGIPGKWFLIRLDIDALSIFHFPYEDPSSDETFVFREFTIFTIATTNLYFYQSDLNDRICSDFRPDYHDKISSLSEEIKTAHGHNYSLASYFALRHHPSDVSLTFTSSDFEHALSYCQTHQITDDVEINPDANTDDHQNKSDSKLTALIAEILKPIPGGSPYFYFYGEINEKNEIQCGEEFNESRRVDAVEYALRDSEEPLFVSFSLDEKPASLEELRNFSSSNEDVSVLSAFITTFKSPDKKQVLLPKLHEAVARNLVTRLNSYVAEQTLERLLRDERTLKEYDRVQKVKRCLFEAENVVYTGIPVHFYFSKIDSMLDTSTSGLEGDFQQSFSLLCACIEEQRALRLTEVSNGEFFATDIEQLGWCFINVPENYGHVSIYVYHPSGFEIAEEVDKTARQVVTEACHRTNQKLLLQHMHQTRSASTLMIPEHIIAESQSEILNDRRVKNSILEYPAGYFQCDESFKTSYSLNRRCKLTNVIINLERSVFHSFALSNRRGIFVYKDEEDRIFYMKLQPRPANQGVENGMDMVDFLVYGVELADPLITTQLDRLIQKKLLQICTEDISVLTKNPYYNRTNLSDSDIKFIQDFSENWRKLECNEDEVKEEKQYAFPVVIYDPVMVLVYFRQNISGSTFFTLFSDDEKKDVERLDNHDIESKRCESKGVLCAVNQREFNLVYNANQFQLGDKSIQPTSTLTEAGRQFSRKAGTGIALIEIKLLDATNQPLQNARIGATSNEKLSPAMMANLKFHHLEKNPEDSKYNLSVRIRNTTLNTDALHSWIELTLNQAMLSWVMERHLERSTYGLRSFVPDTIIGFKNIIQISTQIPHPALKRVDFSGNVKSTQLPKLVFNLLECLMTALFDGKKRQVHDIHGLQTFRFCGNSMPRLVRLFSLSSNQTVHAVDFSTNELIPDNPATSPQYISTFGLSEETEKLLRSEIDKRKKFPHTVPHSSFLFQKVFVDDRIQSDDVTIALKKLMISNPSAFLRRIAFLVIVTRTSTSILFYNWNPNMYESLVARLDEKYSEFNASKKIRPKRKSETTSTKTTSKSTSILMPTIVGSSVKGSAMQAVVMSRARARASTSRSASSVKPAKHSTGNSQGSKVMQRSTWKARNKNTKMPKSDNKENNELLRHLPTSLIKEYMAVQGLISKMSLKGVSAENLLQKMLLSWLMKSKEKDVSIPVMDFILVHANSLKSETCHLIQSIVDDPLPFLSYLAKVILSHGIDAKIIAKNFSWKSEKGPKPVVVNHSMYIMKKVLCSNQKWIFLVHEIAVISHIHLGKIGRCRSWSFLPHDQGISMPFLVEQEMVLSNQNLRCEMFNFASSLLRGTPKHNLYSSRYLNIPLVLKETRDLFPSRIQKRTKVGSWFRLCYRTILWEDSSDFATVGEFIDYVLSNNSEYGLSDCSGDVKCIGGRVCGDTEDAHFFMTPCDQKQDENVTTFQLFIIVFTHGRQLENYYFEKGCPYAKKITHHIFDVTKATILNILRRASIDYRRDQLFVEQSDWV